MFNFQERNRTIFKFAKEKKMIKYFKNRFGGSINLADKTHPKPQRRPEKAKNQLDVYLNKEKIMKSNQAKPRNPRRIPARPGVAAISASSPSSPTTPGGENHQAPQADLRCLETSSPWNISEGLGCYFLLIRGQAFLIGEYFAYFVVFVFCLTLDPFSFP